jgi:quercetin dioxygenase-like cupin family protein
MTMKQQIVQAAQGQNYDWANDHIYVKTARDFTDGRVTVVEDTLKPGFHLARHYHKKMVEIFYILDGEVEFKFDDKTVFASAGMTLNVPPNTWHEVTCRDGGKLITIFTPGGFDKYLQELASLAPTQFSDEALMTALAEKYDTWNA